MRISALPRVDRKLTVEIVAIGLAYGSGLCWASTCIVASFRPGYLTDPYWSAVPDLRTDTCGAVTFIVMGISLAVGKYLHLKRHYGIYVQPEATPYFTTFQSVALGVSETIAVLSTGLVVYLSVNAVTHPASLGMHATHFAPWPTEGTLRVLALLGCTSSVGVICYLRAGRFDRGSVKQSLAMEQKYVRGKSSIDG
jgi:hypothetical protein